MAIHKINLDQMRELSGKKDLVRPGATCFETTFLTLTNMWNQRQVPKALSVSTEWYTSKLKNPEGGKAAENIVLSVPIWHSVEHFMRASQRVLKALRIVDGDESPTMPKIWAAMDFAKEHIKDSFAKK